MKNWFSKLLKPRQVPAAGTPDLRVPAAPAVPSAELLGLQKENQSLRMDLETSRQAITSLKQEVERLRLRQDQLITETVEARLSGLFVEMAAPASQILTQANLLEKQDKPVQARDVLSVARRMVRALERSGVAFAGQVGEQVSFDPNHHTPISAAAAPQAGQPVTIRFAGVTYQDKTIYKAIVE